jgi:hypothetical protein
MIVGDLWIYIGLWTCPGQVYLKAVDKSCGTPCIYFNVPFKKMQQIYHIVCPAVLDIFGGFFDDFVACLLALKKTLL